ncbi:protein ENHANCED DOWNY MILDEW 2 isoform X2 [Lycium ferocissimum]|uniref:protein ENHANCED DOWNY MILDEW 2 isoform X2 n=1 Tax=Lycium ferocissimum TaxID=112874 RepID=UPI0028157A17|nr:protein ENHANCED DOWNY MILDEW 2 isoform X2 [Lycium ferocissimum]
MASSDDEAEAVPSTVSNYEFVDDKDEPVSFAELTFQWNDTESLDGNKGHVFLRGTADNGLQKIYKQVTTWKIDSSRIEPAISVLSKENDWIKLEKPRKAFQDTIRSILITVHSLHFLKKNPESSGRALWDHLSKVFSVYEPRPSENDLVDHMNFINEIVKRDGKLSQSKVLLKFLEEKPKKKKIFDEVGSISDFIVDEIIDDNEEEDDDDYNHFESLCAICDDGGELLCCDGKCLRSFHATVEDGAQSQCESLGFTKAQVKAMKYQDFYCKNCEYQQHQCYACGKLGSSDQSSHAEVFRCVNATCGHFYHPHCVARLLHPDAQSKVDELKKKIAAGESFACPLHQCCVCQQREDKDKPELQFAMCRRCPTSYHRKCLPKEIVFDKSNDEEENEEEEGEGEEEEEEEDDVMPRAWDGLIKNRILIYCLKHEIDEELATPSRDHIKFPGDRRREKQTQEQTGKPKGISAEVTNGKRVIAKKSETVEKLSKAVKVDFSRKRERPPLPDSLKRQKVIDANRKSLNKSSSAKLNKATKSEGKTSLGDKLYALISRESQIDESGEEEKTKIVKSDKKERSSSQTLDAASKSRILSMMEDAKSLITMDKIVKHKVPTTHAYSSKFDKSITLGKVEGSVEAIRAALQILEEGGKVEDAKAVCEPGLLAQIMKWRSKLRVYLAPFLHGMRYTSFGRHFTKVEKLREIVDMLHWYVRDGDMILDFCCGSNDFSCLMKKKLDEIGRGCLYKNYDLFQAKNAFNFEKKDWMAVRPEDLPVGGSKLIMGLNPPFGVNAVLANKFINKALEFKPKLLILIVPKETQRLDLKGSPYDLIWEDHELLSGKSFYLPGSVDSNDKQMEDWNVSTPPLYLWSRSDWTANHKAIAQQHGHPSKIKLEKSCSDAPVPRSLEHDEDVSTKINNDIGFEDKKRHQPQEYKERSQNKRGKEGGDHRGHGKNKSHEKSMKGSQDKSKMRSDEKSMKGSRDRSKSQRDLDEKSRQDKSTAKRQRDLDEKSRQDKSTAKRQRDLDEKATEDRSVRKRSLSHHSSPSMTNRESVDRHTILSSKAEEKDSYQHFAGKSISALRTEQETGYGVHQDSHMERRHILPTEEPYSSLAHQYPQSANPGPEYMGNRAHQDGDMARRNSLPMQEPYSSLNHQYPRSASPGSEYAFRASEERFMGYQREHPDIPGRPYTSHRNGGIYARESDVRAQGNLYGQQGDEFLTQRSNYVAGASTGYPHPPYGRLSPAADPTYGRINTPVMQQYPPHEDLYPGRMNGMESDGRSGIYGGGVARPGFQGSSSGFAPRPYYPYSQQNSSGWLNE